MYKAICYETEIIFTTLGLFSSLQINNIFSYFPRKQALTFHANCVCVCVCVRACVRARAQLLHTCTACLCPPRLSTYLSLFVVTPALHGRASFCAFIRSSVRSFVRVLTSTLASTLRSTLNEVYKL